MLLLPKKAERPRLRFIAEAVSYRLPRPVTEVVTLRYGGCYPVCPRCSCSVEREYMAYCDRCGQCLSWYALSWADVQDSRGEEF
jgi:hypothetical protein